MRTSENRTIEICRSQGPGVDGPGLNLFWNYKLQVGLQKYFDLIVNYIALHLKAFQTHGFVGVFFQTLSKNAFVLLNKGNVNAGF